MLLAGMEIVRLHHVSFAVKDLEASRRFFGGVIGLSEIDRPAFNFAGAWFAIGDRQLHLIQETATGRDVTGRISRSDHMALEVADIAEVRTRLDQAGIAYQQGSNDALGFSQVFCSDPDGHTIEFVRYF
jgi:catechol 2,3-dioxygenase-like lactoylglutathione lyase family enzyme